MNNFGVVSPFLKEKAAKPEIPKLNILAAREESDTTISWRGSEIKKLKGLGEMSATGMHAESGILITKIDADSPLSTGLRERCDTEGEREPGEQPATVVLLLRRTILDAYGRPDDLSGAERDQAHTHEVGARHVVPCCRNGRSAVGRILRSDRPLWTMQLPAKAFFEGRREDLKGVEVFLILDSCSCMFIS